MEIGPADTASFDPDNKVTRNCLWLGNFFQRQRYCRLMQDHGSH
jgi:hypothetical protein